MNCMFSFCEKESCGDVSENLSNGHSQVCIILSTCCDQRDGTKPGLDFVQSRRIDVPCGPDLHAKKTTGPMVSLHSVGEEKRIGGGQQEQDDTAGKGTM
mmetsp:Transcript_7604/g.17454  ORF Transcript_7604/g.17454 Transcript_7604/m.17454 type:complete len:99 (+) Transcript_7604:527-823(+)